MAAQGPPPPPNVPMYMVFNAFELIPPPPDFPTFVEGWLYTASNVQKNKCFLVTQLHRNINPQGTYVWKSIGKRIIMLALIFCYLKCVNGWPISIRRYSNYQIYLMIT